MVQVSDSRMTISVSEFRMVAEPRLTMREITGPERQEDNERESTHPQMDSRGSGATEDRETMFEYNEEREIDNEYVTGNEYSEYKEMEETDENKETMEYNVYGQTIKFCNETDEFTVHMIKMNIKLPNPTTFD
eukprot:1341871-Amphidinium_carterae.1